MAAWSRYLLEIMDPQGSNTARWSILPVLIAKEGLRGAAPVLHSLTNGMLLHATMVLLQSHRGMKGYS